MARKPLTNHVDVSALCQAARRGRWALEPYRRHTVEHVRQLAGSRWSDDATPEDVLVNLISLYCQIMGRKLIGDTPRALMSTFQKQAKHLVGALESYGNGELDRMQIGDTFRRCVMDAFFCMGICKVALATPSDAARFGWNQKAGHPFACPVLLDDYVRDPHARTFVENEFEGHRFRVPLDSVRDDSKLYSKGRKELTESMDRPYNEMGDERINRLSLGYRGADGEEFIPKVDLWEFYIPSQRLIVTLPDEWVLSGAPNQQEPLRVQRWIGPDMGPYHKLGFQTVPGSAVPKGPIMDLYPLHMSANRAYRKIDRAIDRMKELLLYASSAADDAARVVDASDGQAIGCRNPDDIKQATFGGEALIGPQVAISKMFNDLFSKQGGNLDIQGGLSPQSKTAHQDSMLNQNSGLTVEDMLSQVTCFTSSVLTALAWYWKHDPITVQKTMHSLPGLPDINQARNIGPDKRAGISWQDMQVSVDPYSLQYQTPQSRMQAIDQTVMQIILPMMPLLQQQGIAFDASAYMTLKAKLMNQPDLTDLLTIRTPPAAPSQGGGGGQPDVGGMPQSTERTYNRVSTPSQTDGARDNNLEAAMLGVNNGGAHRNGKPKGLGV